jgi:mRNA interferase HigB
MRVIALKTLRDFIVPNPSSKPALLAWYEEAGKAKWQKPMDIKKQFANASFVGQNRVIFNIKGNDYRLIVAIAYRLGVVYIKFVGTHKQYDVINASTIDMN